MSRISVGNIDFEGAPAVGIRPDSPRYNYEHFRVSNFYGVTGLLKSNFPIHQPRRVTFWSKTSISMDRRHRVEFSQVSAYYNYEGFRFAYFMALWGFKK